MRMRWSWRRRGAAAVEEVPLVSRSSFDSTLSKRSLDSDEEALYSRHPFYNSARCIPFDNCGIDAGLKSRRSSTRQTVRHSLRRLIKVYHKLAGHHSAPAPRRIRVLPPENPDASMHPQTKRSRFHMSTETKSRLPLPLYIRSRYKHVRQRRQETSTTNTSSKTSNRSSSYARQNIPIRRVRPH